MIPEGNPTKICVHDYLSQCLVNLRSPGRQRAIHKQHRRHQNGLTCHWLLAAVGTKKLFTLLDLCVSSLRRGHANLLCIVPILTDDPRKESTGGTWGQAGGVGEDWHILEGYFNTCLDACGWLTLPRGEVKAAKKTCITSRLVRVILKQGPC